ncbi:MAG: hypothetical protein HZY73_07350 [Micropruina sp.]|nr:MAG: hypothetical protein HZY73_07350 [Micropruina sp.]
MVKDDYEIRGGVPADLPLIRQNLLDQIADRRAAGATGRELAELEREYREISGQ